MSSTLQIRKKLIRLIPGTQKKESSLLPQPITSGLALDEVALHHAHLITDLGIWSVKLDSGLDIHDCPTSWSNSLYGILGQTPEELPTPRVADFLACVHEDDRQALLDTAIAALAAKRPWQREYRIVHPDGATRIVIEIGQGLYDESGTAHTMLGTIRDVTHCRQVAATLRDNASRLQLALKGAGAGNYDWDVATDEIVWSDELCSLLGVPAESEVSPREQWMQIAHPDDVRRVLNTIEHAVAENAEWEIEWRTRSDDGESERWFLDRARPVYNEDGSLGRYHGIIIDVTERKLTQLALDEYREQLEEMVNERTSRLSAAQTEQQSLNRSLRLLSDCNITLAAAADEPTLLNDLCRLIVLSDNYLLATISVRDEAGGIRSVAHYSKSTLPEARRAVLHKDTLAIGRPTRMALLTGNIQVSQHRRDGTPSPHAANTQTGPCMALPILIEDHIEAVLTIYASNRRGFGAQEQALLAELAANTALGLKTLRARQELEGYRHNLEALVAERTREIAALNDELAARADEAESANLAKSDFLATMSHEIRTPLNAVIGLTSLLAETQMNRRQRNFTEKIHVAAQHLRTLIDDILDFSKIEVGSLILERAPFSLESVMRTTASILAGNIGKKSIEAIFDVAPDIPEQLIGDAFRLQQILLNLSSNAVKFTDAGEILISVQHLPSDSRHAHLRFSVRDTGIGIAPEKIEKIFAAFTQADSSTSRRYGGSGLSLSISARLVESMGGKLEVTSHEGLGSDFHFTIKLPLAAPHPEPAEPGVGKPLAGLRLLVVDDNPRVGRILQRICEHFGWETTIRDSARECLAELQRSNEAGTDYDVMLLDWHMPGTDGLEMLRNAHATPGMGLPLVVLMAAADELGEAIAASDDLYIDGIVAKPLTPASVFDAVNSAYSGDLVELPPLRASQGQPLTGQRLLVAEDNTLNQEVIQQLLSQAGAKVIFADNGLAAVQAIENATLPFDAVLMDIQMPVMDGYEATRRIRDNPAFAELPIIALTAFALEEDRQKSLQAGMTGHITKPIDVDDLLEILGATIRKGPAMPETPPLAIPGIKVDVALQLCGGDIHSLIKLLRAFIDQNGGDPTKARDLALAGDLEGAARLVHGMRGVAAYLQVTDVARHSATAEEALRDKDRDAALPALEALDVAMAALARVVEELEKTPPGK